MKQLEAGDLAIMINSSNPENIGRTVRLIEFAGTPTTYRWDGVPYRCSGDQRVWVVEADEPLKTSRNAQLCGAMPSMRRGPTLESNLMPLRGDFEPEQQREQEEQPCL